MGVECNFFGCHFKFYCYQREARTEGILGGVGIHHLHITHNTHCLPPPPPPQNFANAFLCRCFQQNIFRTFMGSINTESTLGSLFFFNNLYAKISSKLHLIHRWNISFKPLDWSLTNFSARFPHKFCNSPTLLFTEIIIWNEKDSVKYGDSPDRSLARSSRCWKLREAPKKLHRHWTGLAAN